MKLRGVDLGRVGYEAYGDYTGWKTFDGRDMPHWANLGERVQASWRVAGAAIREAVSEHGGLVDEHDDCQLCRIIASQ